MIELLNNLVPLFFFVVLVVVLYFIVLPKWKKGWNNEKQDLARKIAKELKSNKRP